MAHESSASGATVKAWFSETAAPLYGSAIYRTPDGREVEITCLSDETFYKWPDKVCVGEDVTGWVWVGTGVVGRMRMLYPREPVSSSDFCVRLIEWIDGHLVMTQAHLGRSRSGR